VKATTQTDSMPSCTKTARITEANLKASFDHARKLMQARDINDVMQLQSEYLRTRFASATDQFKQMTSGTISAGNDAVDKVTT
jgi:hypothetical protein